MKKATQEQLNKLEEVCRKFINEHQIYGPETIMQVDSVILNAYDLIEDICDVLGYVDVEG